MRALELAWKVIWFKFLMIPQGFTGSHWLSGKMHKIYNELEPYGTWNDWQFYIHSLATKEEIDQ